jgi:hypothetical protein
MLRLILYCYINEKKIVIIKIFDCIEYGFRRQLSHSEEGSSSSSLNERAGELLTL